MGLCCLLNPIFSPLCIHVTNIQCHHISAQKSGVGGPVASSGQAGVSSGLHLPARGAAVPEPWEMHPPERDTHARREEPRAPQLPLWNSCFLHGDFQLPLTTFVGSLACGAW